MVSRAAAFIRDLFRSEHARQVRRIRQIWERCNTPRIDRSGLVHLYPRPFPVCAEYHLKGDDLVEQASHIRTDKRRARKFPHLAESLRQFHESVGSAERESEVGPARMGSASDGEVAA